MTEPLNTPRRQLNWHHFADADSGVDARARLRFSVNPPEAGPHRRAATLTLTLEVGTIPLGARRGGWLSTFRAYVGVDHRPSMMARAEVVVGTDPLTRALHMAEEWVAAFAGPGWSPLAVDDARRSHPPPALPEPQAGWSTGDLIMVFFEDGAEPLLLACDRDRCGLTWFASAEPEHSGYGAGTEAIDGYRIDRIERVR